MSGAHINPSTPSGPLASWTRFWFTPADPFALHLVRVVTGVLLIFWLVTLGVEPEAFFGLGGWFDRSAHLEASRLASGSVPKPASWSVLYLFGDDAASVRAIFWPSLAVLALFTLGIATRLTAPLVWLIVASFTANPAFDDEVDPLFQMLSLYLAVGYVFLGPWRGAPWWEKILGDRRALLFMPRLGEPAPSLSANIALRLAQIHLAILLVASGLHKLQTAGWWSGVAYWYTLYPPLEASMEQIQRVVPWGTYIMLVLNVAAYCTLAWQLLFPAFAWRSGWWRGVLLGGGVVGWIGLAVLYRMPLFGPALLIGCLSFVSSEESRLVWQWVQGFIARNTPQVSASAEREAVGVAEERVT